MNFKDESRPSHPDQLPLAGGVPRAGPELQSICPGWAWLGVAKLHQGTMPASASETSQRKRLLPAGALQGSLSSRRLGTIN